MIGVRMLRKESMKYWFSSFMKAISFRMAKEWDKSQYNKSIPAVENKIGNNSLWVVVTAIIGVYYDVIIKYFILICFFSNVTWWNWSIPLVRVWSEEKCTVLWSHDCISISSNNMISKLFVLWRLISGMRSM